MSPAPARDLNSSCGVDSGLLLVSVLITGVHNNYCCKYNNYELLRFNSRAHFWSSCSNPRLIFLRFVMNTMSRKIKATINSVLTPPAMLPPFKFFPKSKKLKSSFLTSWKYLLGSKIPSNSISPLLFVVC